VTLIDLCSPDESTVPGLVRVDPDRYRVRTVDGIIESSHGGGRDEWYTITPPEGAVAIRLHFCQVGVESGYLYFYDKYDNNLGEYVVNGTFDQEDWSWFDSGCDTSPGTWRYQHVIRKAHLVVDGTVVLEIPAGMCEERLDYYQYLYLPWKLLPPAGHNGMYVLAYPVDNYSSPGSYATNGVADLAVNLDTANDFIKENCYTSYLVGGTYTEDSDHKIKVPLEITPDVIRLYPEVKGDVQARGTNRDPLGPDSPPTDGTC
jgi:hypothetical protein